MAHAVALILDVVIPWLTQCLDVSLRSCDCPNDAGINAVYLDGYDCTLPLLPVVEGTALCMS